MAIAEFLENVDLAMLGLAVVPTVRQGVKAEGALRPWLSPVGLLPILGMREGGGGVEVGLRGRVEQQVDAIAGSANKVLVGMMDTSFGMLKSLSVHFCIWALVICWDNTQHRWTVKAPTYQAHTQKRKGETFAIRRGVERVDEYQSQGGRRRRRASR